MIMWRKVHSRPGKGGENVFAMPMASRMEQNIALMEPSRQTAHLNNCPNGQCNAPDLEVLYV